MRNGFKLTLMVAIALIGMRVSAMAPTMNPIPDPIVGDSDGATGTNEFVYPDALNLDNYASDTDGPAALTWSYEGADDKYSFNGAPGLAPADDPVAPPAAAQINEVDTDAAEEDANPATVTIRNTDLSPIGGPNVDPGAPGIVGSETRAITLYVSDGATISQTEIVVYTENDADDSLSSGEEAVAGSSFDTSSDGWVYLPEFAIGGTVTSSSNTGAICISVTAAGVNGASWASPYNLFELTNGSVYIGRFNMNTSQAVVGNVPLTLIHIENESQTPFEAASAYYSEFYFLDNFGGANAPDAQRMVLFTPPSVAVAEWQNAAFNATNDPINDVRVRFRVLDVDGAGINAEADSGQVCLADYSISKVDISAMIRGDEMFNEQNMTAANFQASGLVNTTVAFAGGDVTVTPQGGNWANELVLVVPGDGNVGGTDGIITGNAAMVDEYPISWDANGNMYELEIGLSAPNATAEDSPVDTFRMGLDAPTQEFIGLSQVTAGMDGIAMPNVGAAQLYRGFYAANDVTLSSTANHHRLRPRFDIICNDQKGFSGAAAGTNPGGMTIHGFAVYEVTY